MTPTTESAHTPQLGAGSPQSRVVHTGFGGGLHAAQRGSEALAVYLRPLPARTALAPT